MKYRESNYDQNIFDDQIPQMLRTTTGYGGFCHDAPQIPFIGKIKEVHLPIGTTRLIFYNYFTYFNIDIIVHIRKTQCFGLINICITCMRLYKQQGNICLSLYL